jgi:hypothetical protein
MGGEFISGIDFDFEILLYVSPTCFLAQLNLTFSEVNCSLPNNGGSIEYFLQAFFPHVTKTSSCPRSHIAQSEDEEHSGSYAFEYVTSSSTPIIRMMIVGNCAAFL